MFIKQLTTDENYYHLRPQISGYNVVWEAIHIDDAQFYRGGVYGEVSKIYFYNGREIIQLNTNTPAYSPKISGNNIVWQENDGNDLEIFFYDGSQTIQLTNNDTDDINHEISGSDIVWMGNDGNDNEIYLYDGTTIKQITNNDFNDQGTKISNGKVVWQIIHNSLYFSYPDLYFYDGVNTVRLTDTPSIPEQDYDISGDNIAWEAGGDIYLYDGVSTKKIRDYIPNQSIKLSSVSEENVVWSDYQKVYLYNGTNTEIIDIEWGFPLLSSNNFVSGGIDRDKDIPYYPYDTTHYEIYFYDGENVTQVTDNEVYDSSPDISGNQIVWSGEEGSNYDIFYAHISANPIHRFQNKNRPSTYLYANQNEGIDILANYPEFVDEGAAFRVGFGTDDNLIQMNRFHNDAVPGTYLYAGIEESQTILQNYPSFSLEGIAFYVYGAGSNLGIVINRLRNLQNNTYLFAGQEETNNILNNPSLNSIFINEGIAFEGLISE